MTISIHSIDATKKSLGRVASETASVLMGKTTPDYQKHTLAPIKVEIKNASKIKVTGGKNTEKVYRRHTHFPGGEKFEKYEEVVAKKGHEEVIRRAVYGMLPANRLRKQMMKRIVIVD